MKTTKGGKVMNPTDAYRKELRKKELKRNKKERKKVREVGILKKDPQAIMEQIEKLEMMKAEGALDKARKHKKRQLEDTLNLVLKKRKEYEEKMKENGETPVMFSHLGPPRRTTAEEEERPMHPKPEDSVYYHPTLNPTGAPPPGKPPMYKSSIGPRSNLSAATSSAAASSSQTDSEEIPVAVLPPPPPPPPPLPVMGKSNSEDNSIVPASLPLPPPPPMPPKPAAANWGIPLPPPPRPPPPPGPAPKEQIAVRPPLPPPPPLPQSAQPAPPGTSENEKEKISLPSDDSMAKKLAHVPPVLPPLVMPPRLAVNQAEGVSSEADANNCPAIKEVPNIVPPPPPPLGQQSQVAGPSMVPVLQPDVLPPGISRFPPPPQDMQAPLSANVLPGQAASPGMMAPLIPRPPLGPPTVLPPMMRPPLPPGPPPTALDGYSSTIQPPLPQKPSYVKSAASTVVKRPLAQHQPELTAMVPASVRVRRETAAPKAKPKSSLSTMTATTKPPAPVAVKPELTSLTSAPKAQNIDDSYSAFLEDMKALGALDG